MTNDCITIVIQILQVLPLLISLLYIKQLIIQVKNIHDIKKSGIDNFDEC